MSIAPSHPHPTVLIDLLDGQRCILHDEGHQDGLIDVILVKTLLDKRLHLRRTERERDKNESRRVINVLGTNSMQFMEKERIRCATFEQRQGILSSSNAIIN